MLPNDISEIAFSKPSDAAIVAEIVNGKRYFPSHAKNSFLMHGTYGTGKTTLAHMLPTLLEHKVASDKEKTTNDWQYRYRSTCVTTTPNQTGLPPMIPANVFFYNCGAIHNNSVKSIVSEVERKALTNFSFADTGGQFNHFIFDELDVWSEASQAQLKGLITSVPVWNLFYITTNNLNNIDRGVISRSIKLEMDGASMEHYLQSVRKNFPKLSHFDDSSISRVIKASNGDWRQIEEMMDRLECA